MPATSTSTHRTSGGAHNLFLNLRSTFVALSANRFYLVRCVCVCVRARFVFKINYRLSTCERSLTLSLSLFFCSHCVLQKFRTQQHYYDQSRLYAHQAQAVQLVRGVNGPIRVFVCAHPVNVAVQRTPNALNAPPDRSASSQKVAEDIDDDDDDDKENDDYDEMAESDFVDLPRRRAAPRCTIPGVAHFALTQPVWAANHSQFICEKRRPFLACKYKRERMFECHIQLAEFSRNLC